MNQEPRPGEQIIYKGRPGKVLKVWTHWRGIRLVKIEFYDNTLADDPFDPRLPPYTEIVHASEFLS